MEPCLLRASVRVETLDSKLEAQLGTVIARKRTGCPQTVCLVEFKGLGFIVFKV